MAVRESITTVINYVHTIYTEIHAVLNSADEGNS